MFIHFREKKTCGRGIIILSFLSDSCIKHLQKKMSHVLIRCVFCGLNLVQAQPELVNIFPTSTQYISLISSDNVISQSPTSSLLGWFWKQSERFRISESLPLKYNGAHPYQFQLNGLGLPSVSATVSSVELCAKSTVAPWGSTEFHRTSVCWPVKTGACI